MKNHEIHKDIATLSNYVDDIEAYVRDARWNPVENTSIAAKIAEGLLICDRLQREWGIIEPWLERTDS